MSTSPKIKFIRDKLLMLGYDVQIDETKLVVKLPLRCSVNIIEDGIVLKTEPRFGYVSRTVATYIDQFLLPVLFLGFAYFVSDGQFSLSLLVLGLAIVAAGTWDAYRYILTENFITRFQMLMIAGIESSDTALTTVSHAAAGKIHKQFGAAAQRQTGSFLQTNLIVICPECGMRVLPKTDGTCPSCQAKIPA